MSTPPSPAFSEAQRQHLEFVQSVIGRMASASGVTKGWALTVATATFGYAGTRDSILVALLGLFAVLWFGSVDARYLREERKFRLLYNAAIGTVASTTTALTLYEMNAHTFCNSLPPAESKSVRWRSILWSWSIRDYYGGMSAVGLCLITWLHCR